jgi:hypothetical protein
MKLYQQLASILTAMANCTASSNAAWARRHRDALWGLVKDCMPRGSGFDRGTFLDLSRSGRDRLVFLTSFHHMNEGGMYDGWTDHEVHITADLMEGFSVRVTGVNRSSIKDHIAEAFTGALLENAPDLDALAAYAAATETSHQPAAGEQGGPPMK